MAKKKPDFNSARECWKGTCDCEVPTRRDAWSIWVSSVRYRLCEWFGRTEECGCMYLLGRQMFWCFPHLFPQELAPKPATRSSDTPKEDR